MLSLPSFYIRFIVRNLVFQYLPVNQSSNMVVKHFLHWKVVFRHYCLTLFAHLSLFHLYLIFGSYFFQTKYRFFTTYLSYFLHYNQGVGLAEVGYLVAVVLNCELKIEYFDKSMANVKDHPFAMFAKAAAV